MISSAHCEIFFHLIANSAPTRVSFISDFFINPGKVFPIPTSKARRSVGKFKNRVRKISLASDDRASSFDDESAMELSLSSFLNSAAPSSSALSNRSAHPRSNRQTLTPISSAASKFFRSNFSSMASHKFKKTLIVRSPRVIVKNRSSGEITTDNDDGFILEDVPHLTDFLPDLPVFLPSTFLSVIR